MVKKFLARWMVNLLGVNTIRKWAGLNTEPKVELGMAVRRFNPATGEYGEWEDHGIISSTVVTV